HYRRSTRQGEGTDSRSADAKTEGTTGRVREHQRRAAGCAERRYPGQDEKYVRLKCRCSSLSRRRSRVMASLSPAPLRAISSTVSASSPARSSGSATQVVFDSALA